MGGASGQIITAILIVAISGGLFWLVEIYTNGLRDPRYLDGWLLASGMALQLLFHIATKTGQLSPKTIVRWRTFHIFVGYLLVAAFLSHSNFSVPHSAFGSALWAGFVLVTLTGLFGTYLAWSLKSKGRIDERVGYDRIPGRVAELAQDVKAVVAMPDPSADPIALPAAPYDAWIIDLYTNHLHDFFEGPRNFSSHLVASQRPLKRLIDEINHLAPYVDAQGQEKLSRIWNLVAEKDRLDFARVHFGLTRAWLLVHVPVTYGLLVLSVLHVLVVYSYSSGTM
ncbi:MAG: hypothetical protein EKK38_03340 [Hyphomicrobium sp.]|nr:MAG: hypothetical protein EKK38_03340 [Hyphomicrobium sp.]